MKTTLLWLRRLCYLSSFAILLFAPPLFADADADADADAETATYFNGKYSNNASTYSWTIDPGNNLAVTWTCNGKGAAAKSIVSSVNYTVPRDDEVTCWGFHKDGSKTRQLTGSSGDVTSHLSCDSNSTPQPEGSAPAIATSSSVTMQCQVNKNSDRPQKIHLGAFTCQCDTAGGTNKECAATLSRECNSTLSFQNDTQQDWRLPGWCTIWSGC